MTGPFKSHPESATTQAMESDPGPQSGRHQSIVFCRVIDALPAPVVIGGFLIAVTCLVSASVSGVKAAYRSVVAEKTPVAVPSPVRTNTPGETWSCARWMAAPDATRRAIVQGVAGSVNVRLRTDGVTGICAYAVEKGQAEDTVGEIAGEIADEAPDPVPGDRSPAHTMDPTDPHQCFHRMQAILSGGAPPPDCVAMGF